MNTNRQLIEQFLQFINTGDAAIGKPIISDDVIFYAPTSPEPMKGFEGYMGVLAMMRGAMPDIQWKIEETISEGDKITAADGHASHRQENLCYGHEHLRVQGRKDYP